MTLPDNDLRYDSPIYIRELQTYLRELSYLYDSVARIDIDGVFGEETEAAVRSAQELLDIPRTGVVDFFTWTMLATAYRLALEQKTPLSIEPFVTAFHLLKKGDTSDVVGMAQWMFCALARADLPFSPMLSTGVFDEATETAVRQLQRLLGLNATGEIDLATWNALVTAYTALGIW